MNALQTYLPQDRLRAIANSVSLPDRTSGSALFADISGFTALTESLRESLGARHGAEELSKRLGAVYSALIAEIEKYGGSVIGFAGDAMMCWFYEVHGSSAARATACAFAMQVAIQAFPALGLKVAITAGDARRFIVGDPEIQRIDTLAGTTVARTAIGEHLAVRGDVLVDEVTASLLGETIKIKEWRSDKESGDKFAVIGDQGLRVEEQNVFDAEAQTVTPVLQALRPYLHKEVYERETLGQGQFLTEFRPCVALFVRFTGIDYDSGSAESELNAFIREVQKIAARYEGTLMDITIGDKGSYAYVNFGALVTHEDDARRAVKAALELRNKTELHLQMGITHGLMRVGAYGGVTRKTFSALGDDVNLAARLMTTATTGEILLSGQVHKAVRDNFTFEPRPPLPMKGKAEPLPVFAVTGESQKRAVRLQEPNYSLPMVGRQQELGIINDKLDEAAKGQGQVVAIVAEAGLGKSRLVAELIRNARRKGFVGFGGACQSDGIHTPYLVWKSIWQAFFDVDPEMPVRKQMPMIESEIADRAPARVETIPLLNVVLDLNIPENDFTKNLEPKIRQGALHALLEDCLKTQANDGPTLIVIEDLHWIDALSHDLLEGLAKALAKHAVCFVLAYRPLSAIGMERLQAPRLEVLPQRTRIELHELTKAEAESAIRAKLAQLYPARGGALPARLVDALMARSQGNPFYLEELLNYVRDRGLDPSDLHQIELPDSLHTLILSRIDQLSEQEKITLRVASIVGRLFRAKWLTGYYPELGLFPQVKATLDALESLDITPLDSPEPELVYLFKHIVTHEVTYESLPFATRAKLHEQLARYLENTDAPVDTIAFHYGRSENTEKQREYWQKAGDAARVAFANEAALDYYGRLHPLLSKPREKGSLHLKRAEVYSSWGRLSEAREHVALGLKSIGQPLPETGLQWQIGLLEEILRQVWHRLRFAIKPMRDTVEKETPDLGADELDLIRAYEILVLVDTLANQGSLADVYYLLRVLNIAESGQRKLPVLARVYAMLGNGVGVLPMHILARNYLSLARTTMVGLDHPASLALVSYHAGLYTIGIGKWDECERALQQALEIFDRLGDRRYRALTLNILGFLSYFQGQFDHSLELYTDIYNEGLAGNHVEHQAWGLNGQAMNLFRQGQMTQATLLLTQVLPLFAIIPDSNLTELLSQGMMAAIHLRQGQFEQARQSADATARLLPLASIPVFSSLDGYSNVANVYLVLWEKLQTQSERSQMKLLAQQACRSLNRFARTYPIAQPRAWLWQGLYDWLDGKPGRARKAWQKSVTAAQKLSMPYDEALAYNEIGQHETGAEREMNLAHANEIFERLGINTNAGDA